MAGTVSTTIHTCFRRSLAVFVLLSAGAQAESLPDPTRPPAELAVVSSGAAVAEQGAVLQSVILSPGRDAAIISGQLVRLGEKFGDDRLVAVSEGQAVLKGAQGRRVLTLFPEIARSRSGESQATAQAAGAVKIKKKTGADQKGAQ